MSTPRRTDAARALVALLAAFSVGGCGDKVPQSEAAKKLGAQPKQIVDKAAADVNQALQQGTEQRKAAEAKE